MSYRQIVFRPPTQCPNALTARNFAIESGNIPSSARGGVLVATRYLSIDPWLCRTARTPSVASLASSKLVVNGESICEVMKSSSLRFSPGEWVVGPTGWRTHALLPATAIRRIESNTTPVTYALDVLGTPGFIAYLGVHFVGKIRRGETVLISAASSPVGAIAGQLARTVGAHVVGLESGTKRRRFLVDDLGFDAAIDERSSGLSEKIRAACPRGIDVYFDVTRGRHWDEVLPLCNNAARIVLADIADAGEDDEDTYPIMLPRTMFIVAKKRLIVRGFVHVDFSAKHFHQFIAEMTPQVASGRIRYPARISCGLELAPHILMRRLKQKVHETSLIRVS
jgi:NADPH-dependent curcumin reductase CurA